MLSFHVCEQYRKQRLCKEFMDELCYLSVLRTASAGTPASLTVKPQQEHGCSLQTTSEGWVKIPLAGIFTLASSEVSRISVKEGT